MTSQALYPVYSLIASCNMCVLPLVLITHVTAWSPNKRYNQKQLVASPNTFLNAEHKFWLQEPPYGWLIVNLIYCDLAFYQPVVCCACSLIYVYLLPAQRFICRKEEVYHHLWIVVNAVHGLGGCCMSSSTQRTLGIEVNEMEGVTITLCEPALGRGLD